MLLNSYLFLSIVVYIVIALEQDLNYIDSNELQESEEFMQKSIFKNHKVLPKDQFIESEKVTVQLYYETMCPYCIDFYTTQFLSVVEKMSSYINITTIPYGNARTEERNGEYTFKCQHGPDECYGNKLHACVIDAFQNITQTVLFNSCMMKKGGFDGSSDKTANACGKEENIDVNPIKECAKGTKGSQLLKAYGDASKEVKLWYVPCTYINGKENKDGDNFMSRVCAAFKNPPPPCQK